MRKEADDTGPLAELEYWKQRTAKFSCLVDQIKSQPCRGVITTLVAAKSKIIKVKKYNSFVGVRVCVHYKFYFLQNPKGSNLFIYAHKSVYTVNFYVIKNYNLI